MDHDNDIIICGTGLTQSILSCILSSQSNNIILHLESNSFHGGEGASLSLTKIFQMFQHKENKEEAIQLGHNLTWKVDLTPKCVLSSGYLTKILLKSGVSDYIHWKPINQDYIVINKASYFSGRGLELFKVPTSSKQALYSDLIGLFQKRRCQKFLQFINDFDLKDARTHLKMNLSKQKSSKIFEYFSLQDKTVNYIQSFALQSIDRFAEQPANQVINRIQQVINSFGVYGDTSHIYPDHGQSQITGKFLKKSQKNGTRLKYNQKINKIIVQNKSVVGIQTADGFEKCQLLIIDPDIARKCGMGSSIKVVKKAIICIHLSNKAFDKKSEQKPQNIKIVLPRSQTGFKHNTNILILTPNNFICPTGFRISIVHKIIQTQNPTKEIQPALYFLGNYIHVFYRVVDIFQSSTDIKGLIITKGYHPCVDLEPQAINALQIYKQIVGQELFLGDVIATQSWQSVFTFFFLELVGDCDEDLMIYALNLMEYDEIGKQ